MTSNSLTWDTAIDINSPQSIGFLWLQLVIIYCVGTVVKCSQKHPRNQKRWKLMIILFQSVSSPFSARLRSSSAITLLAPNNHRSRWLHRLPSKGGIRDLLCQKLAAGGGGNRGRVTTFWDCRKGRSHEKWAVKRGRVMQTCVRDHVEVHPQKKTEVHYFVKKKPGRNFF